MVCLLGICFGAAYSETSLAVPILIYPKQILLIISARKSSPKPASDPSQKPLISLPPPSQPEIFSSMLTSIFHYCRC